PPDPPDALVSDETSPTATYTLSLHDALPISPPGSRGRRCDVPRRSQAARRRRRPGRCRREQVETGRSPGTVDQAGRGCRCQGLSDRKSTRLNSSHRTSSYAVFCLKKKTLLKY